MPVYKFYRSLLSPQNQSIYDILYFELETHNSNIELSCIDKTVIHDVYQAILYDNPLLFYVDGLNIRHKLFSANVIVSPVYRYDKDTADNFIKKLETTINKIVAYSKGFGDCDKVKLAHDLFCNKIVYNADNPNVHNIIGALIEKNAVCDGISKAAKLLFDSLKIKSCIVRGKTLRSGDFNENHAWNKVNIDGNWYNLDITYDIECSKCGYIRYDYFNVADDEISRESTQSQYNYPQCTSNKESFYYKNNLCINSKEEFQRLLLNALKIGNNQLTVKWTNNHTVVTEKQIQMWIEETLSFIPQTTRYELFSNKSTNVFTTAIAIES